MKYNWQYDNWPEFEYNLHEIEDILYSIVEHSGRISGLMEGLPDNQQQEAMLDIMVYEAIKTSEIEGEYLSRKDVMSSIKNNLGFNQPSEHVKDKKAQGISELMINVRSSYSDKLTEESLFLWHSLLMKGGSGIKVGSWRDHEEAMQVISGPIGKEKIHFEAPPSSIVPIEMKRFIQWFNNTGKGAKQEITKPVIRSAIAHLYFETIHPFEDGNGRIGRAISEKALSQDVGHPVLISLSKAIEAKRNDYYDALKAAQCSNEITSWINYFVNLVLEAHILAEKQIDFTLKKTKFFDRYNNLLNDRQLRVLKRMLEEGPDGFVGGMSTKKYIAITKTSKATATRDLQDLVDKNALIPFGEGRGRRYNVNL